MIKSSRKPETDGSLRLALDDTPSERLRCGAISIGNFDGVHLGHAALVRELTALARHINGPAVAISFETHPLELLAPERFMPVLTTGADRSRLLRDLGVDEVVYLRTTPELLRLSPAEFFERIIRRALGAKAIVEGYNFRFGRDRAGDTEMLAAVCRAAGIRFTLVPPFTLDGAPVSSSRVRGALATGDVGEAARLLHRRYQIRGTVATGQRRGRTIGFPTANLEKVKVLLPADGVYAVRAHVDGVWHDGAANIGSNPTFGENVRKIEVHLLDFSGDLYGKEMQVEFVKRIRETRLFAGANELAKQLFEDSAAARAIVAEAEK